MFGGVPWDRLDLVMGQLHCFWDRRCELHTSDHVLQVPTRRWSEGFSRHHWYAIWTDLGEGLGCELS
jgi:hypothetical protein